MKDSTDPSVLATADAQLLTLSSSWSIGLASEDYHAMVTYDTTFRELGASLFVPLPSQPEAGVFFAPGAEGGAAGVYVGTPGDTRGPLGLTGTVGMYTDTSAAEPNIGVFAMAGAGPLLAEVSVSVDASALFASIDAALDRGLESLSRLHDSFLDAGGALLQDVVEQSAGDGWTQLAFPDG